ncbi:hypothetical protein GF380_04380 [Candidatus Uhrbacteria bacterium]|nr:hypothetical protein [Candidatus Uhrbacteria bacterium]
MNHITRIVINVDDTKARGKLGEVEDAKESLEASLKEFLTKAGYSIKETKDKTKELEVNSGKIISRVGEGIDQSWNILNQYLSIAGVTIGGVSGAVIRSVFAGIASLRALATAQLSNPFTAFMATATFLATSIASAQAINAQVQAREEERTLARLQPYIDKGVVVRL